MNDETNFFTTHTKKQVDSYRISEQETAREEEDWKKTEQELPENTVDCLRLFETRKKEVQCS